MNKRHVVFICDDNYVMPTMVSIQSLYDAVKENIDNQYIVHICSLNLSDQNVKKIKKQHFPGFEIELNLLNSDLYFDKMKRINQNSHVTPTALLKFELANIYSDLDEILYLDSDLIIKKDIADIFAYDLDNYYVAAVFEFWKYLVQHYEYTGKEFDGFYFNSGVMRLNLRKFREEHIPEKLWRIKLTGFNDRNSKKFRLMDQDVFNETCADKCLHLPIKFNCDAKFTVSSPLNLLNKVYQTSYASCQQLYEDAIVIHYIGKDEKPWIYSGTVRQELWDTNYGKTIFGQDKLIREKSRITFRIIINKVINSIKYRGFVKTIRYINEKRKVDKIQ